MGMVRFRRIMGYTLLNSGKAVAISMDEEVSMKAWEAFQV